MLRQIATALVYSNVWIAAGAAALTAQTYMVWKLPVDRTMVLFVFLATVATYNFQRLLRFNKWWMRANSSRMHWLVRSRRSLAIITLLALFGAAVCGLFALEPVHLWYLLPAAAIAVLYAMPFVPIGDTKWALRDVPGIKIFLIAGSWVIVTVAIPLAGLHRELDTALIIAERFSFILAITIPFDIRDIGYDPPGQRTIPQLVGIHNSGWLAMLFNLLFLGLVFSGFLMEIYSMRVVLALLSSGVISALALAFSFRLRPELYYSALLDGLTLIQPLLVYAAIR